jgi:hypothetical protein
MVLFFERRRLLLSWSVVNAVSSDEGNATKDAAVTVFVLRLFVLLPNRKYFIKDGSPGVETSIDFCVDDDKHATVP